MKNKQRIISKYLTPVFETTGKEAEWFGYYNYDTLNYDHTKMLCNRAGLEKSIITPHDSIEIGYYDLSLGEWYRIGETDSWNWQQGAMAQWLPGERNANKVIYNCSRNGHLTSRIVDVLTGEIKEIDWAIYGLTPDGKKSIALDMERSYWCRAYHYQSVSNPEKDGRVLKGDGIYEIDLESNTRRILIDIEDVIALDPDSDFAQKKHWLEHIMINPSGTRFCFLHRYSPVDNVLQYRTRICVANIDGSGIQVIPGWNTFMWSHFGWQGDDSFAIYTYKRPAFYKNFDVNAKPKGKESNNVSVKVFVRKIALGVRSIMPKSLMRGLLSKNSYYQHYVLDKTGKYQLEAAWIKPYFDVDGHPSFTADGKYMLTDSYPDQENYRRYIVYNTETGKGLIVARMPENKLPGNSSCDLHPKLSRDNQFVVFDTTSSSKHSMMLFKLNWELITKEII